MPRRATENDDRPDGTRHTSGDSNLAELARAQHGVVSLAQLRGLGLTASAARSRAATGRLHRIHRGVYAVGHSRLTGRGLWMAAVLACGPGAVLSHRSAAALHDLRRSDRRIADVTTPSARPRRGIDVHRGRLDTADITRIDGIPCTTIARTLLDLAEAIDAAGLERAMDRAEQLRLLDVNQLDDAIARAPGRHGVRRLRAALAAYDPERVRTRSELERRFLRICQRAGVPRPRVNYVLIIDNQPIEIDFAWPDLKLAVETDGHATHGTRRAFENDRRRDQTLKRHGWDTLRFTWRQIAEDPAQTQSTLAAVVKAKTAERPRQTQSTLAAVVNAKQAPSLH